MVYKDDTHFWKVAYITQSHEAHIHLYDIWLTTTTHEMA